MKVLQINAVYGHGSTGTIVRDVEQLCEQSDIECYVASPDIKVRDAKRGYVIGNALDHKLHALMSRIHGKQAYFSHIPTKNLLHWMDKVRPDIVHLHNLHSNYINLNMLLDYLAKKDIRTIITLHDCWFYTGGCFHYASVGCNGWLRKCGICPKGKRDPIAIFSKKTAQILADRKKRLLSIPRLTVTGVSDWISGEARKTFLCNCKIVTIHNGVDLTVFKPTPSDLRKRLNLEGKYVILGPASKWLHSVNREMLEKFTKLMQPDEVLLLFGAVQEKVGLPFNVRTYGYTKDRTELSALYTMADVFANTTREDSLSLINIEAQACGTPVVTFLDTGVFDTVDNEFGYKVKTGDAFQLYDAIVEIKNRTIDKKQMQHWVRQRFDYRLNYIQYIRLYEATASCK